MAFKKGQGGRNKGSVNKRTKMVEEMAAKYAVDPFEVLMMIASADWKALGYDSPTKISYTSAGIEFEEPWIKISDRVSAAKDACKYLYAQKQAVSIDLNSIQKMSDEEFEKYKAEFIKQYVLADK